MRSNMHTTFFKSNKMYDNFDLVKNYIHVFKLYYISKTQNVVIIQ